MLLGDPNSPFPVGTLRAMNGALLVLIMLVVAAIGFAMYARQSDGPAHRRLAGRCQGRCPPHHRAARRPGVRRSPAPTTPPSRRSPTLGALHRGVVPDRPGHQRQARPAGQGERDGRPVLRARRPHRDGHGSRTRAGDVVRVSGRRARSPRTVECSSKAARSRRRRPRRSAPRTTTRAAASPAVRCPPAGTPSRGGSRRWSRAPGAWVRRCCSARCSPACTASATTHRHSRTATVRFHRTG